MKSNRLHLYSPYPPPECAARLAAAMDSEPTIRNLFADSSRAQPVIGRIRGGSLRLYKRIDYRNSFQSILTAGMQPAGAGTAIVGRFAMHPFVLVFMAVWFGFLGLVAVPASLLALGSLLSGPASSRESTGAVAFVPLGMMIFGGCLLAVGRWLARAEAPFITQFLVRTLDAEDQLPPPLPPRDER